MTPANRNNQDLVFSAIARGNGLVGDIMHVTGFDEDTVRTAITRLRDAGRIGRTSTRDDFHRAQYFVAGRRCLLAECWRGVRV